MTRIESGETHSDRIKASRGEIARQQHISFSRLPLLIRPVALLKPTKIRRVFREPSILTQLLQDYDFVSSVSEEGSDEIAEVAIFEGVKQKEEGSFLVAEDDCRNLLANVLSN